jgi:hypothetical protein
MTPIGGYFERERRTGAGLTSLEATRKYRSARSAMTAVLRAAGANPVWVPHYVCSAVNDALARCGVIVRRYALSQDWSVPDAVELHAGERLICIDYFGLCDQQVRNVVNRFGGDNVLVDAAQSLYFRPSAGESVIYSPRKFFGLPDGGLLLTSLPTVTLEHEDDDVSRSRSRHLTLRSEGRAEEGYPYFQAAEDSLAGCEPIGMSDLTRQEIDRLDAVFARQARISNYHYLSERLHDNGYTCPALADDCVPLCCPVNVRSAGEVRARLAAQRIYTPRYWPDAVVPAADIVGRQLQDETVFLPCDHRYDHADMDTVIRAMLAIQEQLQ